MYGRTLNIVAASLGRKYGVNVQFVEQRTASTDGNTIRLPATLLLEQSEDKLIMVRGYIDHESAHIRWTQFDAPIDTMTNVLEDVRIERKMGDLYPGSAENLAKLVVLLKEKKHAFSVPEDADGIGTAALYVLTKLRSEILGQDLRQEAKQARSILGKHYTEETIQTLDALLQGFAPQNIAQCRELAKKIMELLVENYEQQQPLKIAGQQGGESQNEEEDSDSAASQGQDESQDSDSGENAKAASSESGDHQQKAASGPKPKSGKKGKKHNDGGTGDSDGMAQTTSASPSEQGQTLTPVSREELVQALEEACRNLDLGEILRGIFGTDAANSKIILGGHDMLIDPRMPLEPLVTQAQAIARYIAPIIRERIQSLDCVRRTQARCGTRLNTRALARVATTPTPLIYEKKHEGRAVNCTVYLVVDASSSMNGEPIEQARLTSLSLALAFKDIKNVKLNVLAFTTHEYNERRPLVATLYGEHYPNLDPRMFCLRAVAGTPMTEVLEYVMSQITDDGRRKLLYLITDGQPAKLDSTIEVLSSLRNLGVETYGIGITSADMDSMRKMFQQRQVYIENIKHLPAALMSLMLKHI